MFVFACVLVYIYVIEQWYVLNAATRSDSHERLAATRMCDSVCHADLVDKRGHHEAEDGNFRFNPAIGLVHRSVLHIEKKSPFHSAAFNADGCGAALVTERPF